MPSIGHAPPPPEHEPPPCDCGGCQEFAAIHGRFCAEPPLDDRVAKRVRDRAAQRRYEDAEAALVAARRAA